MAAPTQEEFDSLLSAVTGVTTKEQSTPLTGDELLEVVKENAQAPKDELLTLCGYFTAKEGGRRSYRYTEFYQALIEAQGITLQPPTSGTRGGRELPYKVTCQKGGQVLLGAAYTREGNFKTGQRFKVEVMEGSIKLTPVRK